MDGEREESMGGGVLARERRLKTKKTSKTGKKFIQAEG